MLVKQKHVIKPGTGESKYDFVQGGLPGAVQPQEVAAAAGGESPIQGAAPLPGEGHLTRPAQWTSLSAA